MQTQLKKTFPFLITSISLILAGTFSYSLFLFVSPTANIENRSSSYLAANPTPSFSPTTPATNSITNTITPSSLTPSSIPTPSLTPTSTPNFPTTTPDSPSSLPDNPSPSPESSFDSILKVSLQIDSDQPFTLNLNSSQNHCQVLETALAQSKLSSLDLRFHSSLSSYAVYQINGLGQANQVWWTYSVNGQQPPYGCSQVMVNNGDIIHWTYAGPR